MALIKCPECGKEISDKSEKCIHCGFPIRNTPYIQEIINGKSYDVSFLIDKSMTQIQKIQKLNTMTGCGLPVAKNIVLKYHPTQSSTNLWKYEYPENFRYKTLVDYWFIWSG